MQSATSPTPILVAAVESLAKAALSHQGRNDRASGRGGDRCDEERNGKREEGNGKREERNEMIQSERGKR
jgi:hypothetical protein